LLDIGGYFRYTASKYGKVRRVVRSTAASLTAALFFDNLACPCAEQSRGDMLASGEGSEFPLSRWCSCLGLQLFDLGGGVMTDRRKENTLVEQTIARLLEFRGMEIPAEGSAEKPGTLRAPSPEHLDFSGAHSQAGQGDADRDAAEETQWTQPDSCLRRDLLTAGPRVSSARQKTMAMLVPILSLILLVVLNRFHGVPFLGSEWLRLGMYRTMVGHIIEPAGQLPSVSDKEGQHPVRLKVRGIAYSQDKPAAVIGTTIVHEGDLVLGATVLRITRDEVEFEVNGERWVQKVQ